MKMSPPLNSMLRVPVTGIAGSNSASAETNKVTAVVAKSINGHLLVALALTTLALLSVSTTTAKADDFELAMVIKETTNPYYNATLAGARIAAKEIGGTANNYGPTQSSGQAQVELINNLADRHIRAIAVAPSDPDAVVPAMKRAQKLGAKVVTFDADSAPEGRPFFVNQATKRFHRSIRRRITGQGYGTKRESRYRICPADSRQSECLDQSVSGRTQEVQGHRNRGRGVRI